MTPRLARQLYRPKSAGKISLSVLLEVTEEDLSLTGSQQQELESRAGMTGESHEF